MGQAKTLATIPLDNNEAAFSLAIVSFAARGGELHLVVGTAADTFLSPRSCKSGYLRTYKFTDNGAGLEFMHKVGFYPWAVRCCLLTSVQRLKQMMYPSPSWLSGTTGCRCWEVIEDL